MIRQDKLRCIIPCDTTIWFNANYYKLDSARQTSLGLWMSDYLDVNIRDLRIDIDTQTPRFVIFYRQSKLEKHAAESKIQRLVACGSKGEGLRVELEVH